MTRLQVSQRQVELVEIHRLRSHRRLSVGVTAPKVGLAISNTDALQKLPAVFEQAVAIGGAVDQFKADLRHTFIERLNIPIWENVRTGKLQVWEEFRDLDRRGEVQTLTRKRDYASINGIAMLSPEVKTFAFRASQFLDGREFLERDG